MRYKLVFFALFSVVITSCSNTYRNTQTPDDVYYSPARAIEEAEVTDSREYAVTRNTDYREISMSRYDSRWRYFNDDFNYFYDPYRYGYTYGYYYNPYYYPSPVFISGAPFINPKNTTPRMTNLGAYNYSNMEVVNPKSGPSKLVRTQRRYNNSNNSSTIRRVITPTIQPNRSENNTRTYSPSNNSSGGSGSGRGGSGAPVSRPGRG